MGAHTPENTVLWRDPLQPSPGTVPVPAGSPVIRDGRRVRLDRTELAWVFTIPSSRAGVPDHSLTVALDGSWALCSCAACVNRDRCTLVDNPAAILRHHGLLPPADPGGAVGEPPELAGLTECEDGETVELSPEHPGGFWAATAYGPMHVSGDPRMSDETLGALREMAELAVRQHLDPTPNALDALVAAGGDRWLVNRATGRVALICPTCGRVAAMFASEDAAAAWLEGGGVCGCGGGPTPPAPGAGRKPLNECLLDLYGG